MSVEAVRQRVSADVRWLALPGIPGESVKACIRRVSMKTGLNFSILKRLWYCEYKRIPADISETVERAVKANAQRQEQEWQLIKQRYWAVTYGSGDPDFHAPAHEACGPTGEVE